MMMLETAIAGLLGHPAQHLSAVHAAFLDYLPKAFVVDNVALAFCVMGRASLTHSRQGLNHGLVPADKHMNCFFWIALAQAPHLLFKIRATQRDGYSTWNGVSEPHDHVTPNSPTGRPLAAWNHVLRGPVPAPDGFPPQDNFGGLGIRNLGEMKMLSDDLAQIPRCQHTSKQWSSEAKIVYISGAPKEMGLAWRCTLVTRCCGFDGCAQGLHHGQQRGHSNASADCRYNGIRGARLKRGRDGPVQTDSHRAGSWSWRNTASHSWRVLTQRLYQLRGEVADRLNHKRNGSLLIARTDGKIVPLTGDFRYAHPRIHPSPAIPPPPARGLVEIKTHDRPLCLPSRAVPNQHANKLCTAQSTLPSKQDVQPIGDEEDEEGQDERHADTEPIVGSV
mmetsp:Transcript_126540/g.289395  ORF Transcript_126540/g.289395 Transcript_126540/m.289395 type:complete len:391 (-) Transcript_126540:233-1405(-)